MSEVGAAVVAWVEFVHPTLTVVFARQTSSAPRAVPPYIMVRIVNDQRVGARCDRKTTTTPSGAEFERLRYYDRTAIARIDAFGDDAIDLVKALEYSIDVLPTLDELRSLGVTIRPPLMVDDFTQLRDNRWEGRAQADFPIGYYEVITDSEQAIETLEVTFNAT